VRTAAARTHHIGELAAKLLSNAVFVCHTVRVVQRQSEPFSVISSGISRPVTNQNY
jgi:hypothetical protein